MFVHTSECAAGKPEAVEYSLSFLPNLKKLGCVAYVIFSKHVLVAAHAEAIQKLVQIPFRSSSDRKQLEHFVAQTLAARVI